MKWGLDPQPCYIDRQLAAAERCLNWRKRGVLIGLKGALML